MADQPDPNQKFETVFDTADETEAAVVQGLLETAGIESLVTSPDAPGEVMTGLGGVALQVPAERAEEARQILREYRQRIVDIFSTKDLAQAELIQSRLDSAEIDAIVTATPGRTQSDHPSPTYEIRIPEADIEKALPILAEFGPGTARDGSDEPPQAASA